MTVQVPVRLTEEDVAALDAAVEAGRYKSRSDALRAGVARILREERDREIGEAIPKRALGTRRGELDPESLDQLRQALRIALEID